MGVFYVYEDHSGSIDMNQTGYEVAVNMPASYLYNFAYDYPDGVHHATCRFVAIPQGGVLSPAGAVGRTYAPQIQFYDDVYGWGEINRMTDFIDHDPGGTRDDSIYGLASDFKTRTLNVSNPVRFRIRASTAAFTGVPTVSWSGLYVGYSDECHLEPSAPAAVVGTGDVGAWTMLASPVIQGAAPPNTLPNGAPLAGRNRVQLIG